MSVDNVVAAVDDIVSELDIRQTPQTYLFGSRLSRTSIWSDIDILVVCKNESDGQVIRNALHELISIYPIDLIIMTIEEEREFDFIKSERCRLVS